MNPPRSEGFVRMPDAEFEAILTRAAEDGARDAALSLLSKGPFPSCRASDIALPVISDRNSFP